MARLEGGGWSAPSFFKVSRLRGRQILQPLTTLAHDKDVAADCGAGPWDWRQRLGPLLQNSLQVRQASIGFTVGAEVTKFLHMLQTPKQLRIFNVRAGQLVQCPVLGADAVWCMQKVPHPLRSLVPWFTHHLPLQCDRGVLAFDAAVCLGVDPLEGDVPVRASTPQV